LQTFACDDTPSSSYAKQVVRLYHAGGNPDIEGFVYTGTLLGPLPSHRELISSWKTAIFSGGSFHTDDQGFEFLPRQYDVKLGIEGNYYPFIYAAFIQDTKAQLSLIGERAHGVVSLQPGQLEVMVHRNPDMGDGFGPSLTDNTIVSPSLRAIFETPAKSKAQIYKQTLLMNFPILAFQGTTTSPKDWISKYSVAAQLLTGDLPPNIHIQALNALDSTSKKAILRLVHLFAVQDDPMYSVPVKIDLSTLFKGVKIVNLAETTLTANNVLVSSAPLQFEINPKEIRTFIIEFA